MVTKYTATKGRKKLTNLTKFDAGYYASVGGWKVTGFKKPRKKRRRKKR